MKWKHWRFYGFHVLYYDHRKTSKKYEWNRFKLKFSCISGKSKSSSVRREHYHDIIPCRWQGDNHLTILFWIDSKCQKNSKTLLAVFCLSKKIKNMKMRSLLLTLCANTVITKERAKPACHFIISKWAILLFKLVI